MGITHCYNCKKMPHELAEYIEAAKEYANMTPEEYVKREEGTYNSQSGTFYCTPCYISVGMHLGVAP